MSFAPLKYPPTNVDKINEFVTSFNLYTSKLAKEVVDNKQWEDVERKWNKLVG